jgi:hypothetical protein
MESPLIPGRVIVVGVIDLVNECSAATPDIDTNNKATGNSFLIAKYSLFKGFEIQGIYNQKPDSAFTASSLYIALSHQNSIVTIRSDKTGE